MTVRAGKVRAGDVAGHLGAVLFSAAVFIPGAAVAWEIAVDPMACRRLERHVPAPDVAYQPGVDVRGKPVAPADLPGGASAPVPNLHVEVTADMARHFGIALPDRLGRSAVIGTITVDGNRSTFNGQPLSAEAQFDLVVLCRRVGGARP